MPRKSAEALAGEYFRHLNAPPPPPHPEPPEYLSERAAEHWREIVASKPSTYFDAPNQILLASLCQSFVTSDFLWGELNRLDPLDPKQWRRYRSISVAANRETKMQLQLMTKLRLLPSRTAPVTLQSVDGMPWQRHI